METPQPTLVCLQNDHVSLVLAGDGDLPEVLHWGAPLGEVSATTVEQLRLAHAPHPYVNGIPDEPRNPSLLPEQWTGWGGVPGVSGSRQGRDWAPRFRVTHTTLDGKHVRGFVRAAAGLLVIHAEDAACGLALQVHLELVGALVRAKAVLTNTGEPGYQLDHLVLALPVPLRATELLDFAGHWGKERVPQRRAMGVGTHWRENRHGRTGADSAYVLHLGAPGFGFGHGEVWGVHTAWSGNHLHYAERTLHGDQLIGGGELLLPGEVVLDSGQSYSSPWVLFTNGDGLDAIAAAHHCHLRSRPQPVDVERPVTLNVWEAVYFDHDADRLIDLAERAASAGIERFVLDDGWFGARRNDWAGLGDWVVSPDVWPGHGPEGGLHPLVDRVTALGMQFGLWFEPEMVNPDSDLARAHPEWVMQVPGRTPLTSRHQWVLNTAIPEAYAHVRDQMMALLGEYDISYIKWDHNRDVIDAGTLAYGGRPAVHAQTLAFYRLVDELKAAHPGLEIESCSSGGARIDAEVMQHCDRVWVSDNIDPSDRQQMLRWTTQLLPPEMMGSHIASGASHTTGRQHTLAHRAATAVFGHLGVEWDLARASDEELAELGAWIGWYKAHRRTLLGGTTVRVDLPQQSGAHLHGVVTPAQGIFGFTLLEVPTTFSVGMLPLPGLDPEARYRVTQLALTAAGAEPMAPVELTGRQLAEHGIRAPQVNPEQAVILIADRL